MGQHKTNPTALAAKKGEISPKRSKMGAAETRRRLKSHMAELMLKRGLIPPPFDIYYK